MDNKYAGMTVNERLYTSGLMKKCDEAVSEKDAASVARILNEIELTDDDIRSILDSWSLPLGFRTSIRVPHQD